MRVKRFIYRLFAYALNCCQPITNSLKKKIFEKNEKSIKRTQMVDPLVRFLTGPNSAPVTPKWDRGMEMGKLKL